jgi:uncharacterized membrane protein (DUF373 family)/hemoglobin-like flavoprotein
MRTFQEIKDNYRFTELEMETLKALLPVVEPHAGRIATDFYNLFLQIPDTAKYLKDEAQMDRLQPLHRAWLLAMFQGPYDERYFQRLQRVGHAHVRIGLSAHFVYVGMNLIRHHLHQIIHTEVDLRQQESAFSAVEKILDLNLDIIARTYHEEEIRRVFLSQKLDSMLIRFSQRFTFGLNILLVLGLIGLSLGAVGLVVQDVLHIIRGNLSGGLVSLMGSVLVLWVVIELLDMEIDNLRGGAFKLQLFVGLALVAFIRKVLVSSLGQHDIWSEGVYLTGILVCGVIYWLVSRAESSKEL